MKSLRFGVFLLFVLVGQVKAGQDGIRYTLDSVLQTASRQNYDLASVQAELDAMRADYRKSLSLFLPQLSVSEIYTRTNDPLNVFGLKLKQEIVTQADFNPVTLNQPKAVDNYTTKLEWRQPLLNMDGFFGFRAASSGVKAMEEKSKRTSYYITYQIKIAYYQLLVALQSREVIRKALTAAQTGSEQARNFYDQGLIRRSDVLFAELRLKELEAKQLETENMIDNANNQLKLLMGLSGDEVIIPTDTLGGPLALEMTTPHDMTKRSDIRAMRYQMSAQRAMQSMAWSKFLPSINGFATYEYNDASLFGRQAKNWMVGAMLRWDIFSGFDQISAIQKSNAQYRQTETGYKKALTQSQYDLNAALRQWKVSTRQVVIAEQAVQQSEENYRVLSDRYHQGLDRTTDLLMAEAALSQARLQLIQARFAWHAAMFTVELLTEQSIKN